MSEPRHEAPKREPHVACPICGFIAYEPEEERKHMVAVHPEVVNERLERAGFRLLDGKWFDTLADPND